MEASTKHLQGGTVKQLFLLAAGVSALIGIEAAAQAQVCTQPTPGLAQITTTTASTTLKVTGGTTRANAVDCGFLATSISVIGNAGNETLVLSSIPATTPVTADLGAGINNLNIYLTGGDNTATCAASSCNRDATGGADMTWTGSLGKLIIHGRGGNDTITTSLYGGVTNIFGEDGDDTITSGGGNDTLSGGNGNDVLNGGGGDDTFTTLAGFDGFDTLNGNGGIDTATYAAAQRNMFLGLDGGEDIIGNSTENITGGDGNDTLDFATSAVGRTIRGGDGSDIIRGSAFADTLYGGTGDDTIMGGGGPDSMFGQDGIDDLTGGAGNDTFNGGPGDDVIYSNDTISGEAVNCSTGVDTYVVTGDTFAGCENAVSVSPIANGSFENDYASWTLQDEFTGEDIWGIGIDGDRIRTNDSVFDFESMTNQTYICGDGPTPLATDGSRTSVELQFFQSFHRLYQDVTVPANAQLLWMSMGYLMFGNAMQPDPTFDPMTQFIALEIRDPGTDMVLAEIFKTTEGSYPDEFPMLNLWADISAFAGQTVRINVQIQVNNFCIPVQFDNFKFLVSASGVAPQARAGAPKIFGQGGVLAPVKFSTPTAQASGDGDEGDDQADPTDDGADELDGDTTDDETGGEPGGCSTTGSGGSLATGLLIGLALIIRRRRR